MSSESRTLTSTTLPELQVEDTRTQRDLNWVIKYLRGLALGTGGGHVIQDEGADMPQRANLNFVGAGVSLQDYAGTDRTTVSIDGGIKNPGPDIRIIDDAVQRAGNGVLLFDSGGAVLREYDTIGEAIANVASGDKVKLAAGTYTENITVPAGVTLEGSGYSATIFAGTISLGSGARIDHCTAQLIGDDAGALYCLTVGATGTAYVGADACIKCENSTGPAYAVKMTLGGNLRVAGDLLAEVGTDGYAAWVSSGDFYPDEGRHIGTVALTPYWKEV